MQKETGYLFDTHCIKTGILTPMKATRWSPVGKNTIYAALKNGEIESYTYKGGYIFTKEAFIDYLVKTANDKGKRYVVRGDKKC